MINPSTIEVVNAVASVATALATSILAGATCGLVYVAITQIKAAREENKKWETVKACNLYDTDPVLFECAKRIRELSKGSVYTFANLSAVCQEIRTVLNYFDSLAVGVSQGVYIEQIVQDNLKLVIERAVDYFMTQEFAGEIHLDGLIHLANMRKGWLTCPPTQFRS